MSVTAVDSAPSFSSNGKMPGPYQQGTNGKKNGLKGNHVPSSFTTNSYQLSQAVILALLGMHKTGYSKGVVHPDFSDPNMLHVYKTMLSACHNFLNQHGRELTERVRDLDISDSLLCSSYHQALTKIFEDKINWGRIVAMFCFTEALAYRVSQEGLPQRMTESLISWQTSFIVEYLQEWILKQQGWVS